MISISDLKNAADNVGNPKLTVKDGELTLTRDCYDPSTGAKSTVTTAESVDSLTKRKSDLEASATRDLAAAEAIGKLLSK